MTPEDMAALRKPFEPSQIGRLPKGGVMLDFVGHAVVTSRLLSVDPEWTWEPMGLDDQGLPATDAAGNLWIRLTIKGVTRIGVGDGKSAKEAIGDAIRNAAMRFGVALDLWAKQDLEAPQNAAQPPHGPDLNTLKTRAWEMSKSIMPSLDDAARKEWIAAELKELGAAADVDGLTRLIKEMA